MHGHPEYLMESPDLFVFQIWITLSYFLFTAQCLWHARRRYIHRAGKLFVVLSAVFALCAVSGYARHVLQWFLDTNLHTLSVVAHALLAGVVSYLVLSNSAFMIMQDLSSRESSNKDQLNAQ